MRNSLDISAGPSLSEHSLDYIRLLRIENVASLFDGCVSLANLNAIALCVAFEARQVREKLVLKLNVWRGCLPLGEAADVNFFAWGENIRRLLFSASHAYGRFGCKVNPMDYESAHYLRFLDGLACEHSARDGSLEPLVGVGSEAMGSIVVCALRSLYEQVMEIFEFFASPDDDLITVSFAKWQSYYNEHYREECRRVYERWKNCFGHRTRRKHLKDRKEKDLLALKKMYFNDSDEEFEEVYDVAAQRIDLDGMAHFVFQNAKRFGVSYMGGKHGLSRELCDLFDSIARWEMMEADLKPRAQKHVVVKAAATDLVKESVMAYVGKISAHVSEQWQPHVTKLWELIYTRFREHIIKAGKREKFKEWSKKTVCCLIGHLRAQGVYTKTHATELSLKLEGNKNSPCRRYINQGLLDIEEPLNKEMKAYVAECIMHNS